MGVPRKEPLDRSGRGHGNQTDHAAGAVVPIWALAAVGAPMFGVFASSAISLHGIRGLPLWGWLLILCTAYLVGVWAYEPDQSAPRWCSRACLGMALVAVPLAGCTHVLDTYDLPKQTTSTVLTVAMLLTWTVTRIVERGRPEPVQPLAAAACILMYTSAVCSLGWAVNTMVGLFEAGRILLGVGTLLVVHDLARRPGHAWRILTICGATATTVCCLAAVQSLEVEVPGFPQVVRPAATFGNKNMATEYLVLFLAVGPALVLWGRNLVHVGAGFVVTLLMTYVLAAARTRADWVAGLVSLTVLGFAWAVQRGVALSGYRWVPKDSSIARSPWELEQQRLLQQVPRHGLLLAVLLTGFLMAPMVGWMMRATGQGTGPSLQSAVESALDTSRGSTQWRLVAWANTVKMCLAYPIAGVGGANWQYLYPLWHRSYGRDPTFDTHTQATTLHNDFLQYWAELGVPGELGFVGLFVSAVLAFMGCVRILEHDWGPIGVVGTAGVLAAGAEACFSLPFKLAAPTLMFWVLLALTIRAGRAEQALRDEAPGAGPGEPPRGSVATAPLLLLAVGFGSIFFGHWAIKELESSAHLRLAYGHSAKNRWAEAAAEFEAAAEDFPFVYNPYLLLGRAYYQVGQMRLAVAANYMALRYHPNHCNIHYNLANCYREMGALKEALAAFDRSLEIYPANADAWNNRGNILKALGRIPEALSSFERALAENGQLLEALLNRGNLLMETQSVSEGRALLRKALAINPKFYRAHQALANWALRTRDLETAINEYWAVIKQDPNCIEALNNLGAAYWQKGDARNATEVYERAIRLRHTFAPAYFGLGGIHYRTGRRADALLDYQQFLRYWPQNDGNRNLAQQRLQELQKAR
ncbi:MAG: tetratricopeptide repeat protein [Candidatus Riflebacteria bacterium]|nr:tetratricopeptide repeat protein [Candidatus Riflebacteria bacterium]